MFEFAEETLGMTAAEILNYYRNRYYAEPLVTERGIVANAINDVLPNMVEVVRCKDCSIYKPVSQSCGNCWRTNSIQHPDDFCSHGK